MAHYINKHITCYFEEITVFEYEKFHQKALIELKYGEGHRKWLVHSQEAVEEMDRADVLWVTVTAMPK